MQKRFTEFVIFFTSSHSRIILYSRSIILLRRNMVFFWWRKKRGKGRRSVKANGTDKTKRWKIFIAAFLLQKVCFFCMDEFAVLITFRSRTSYLCLRSVWFLFIARRSVHELFLFVFSSPPPFYSILFAGVIFYTNSKYRKSYRQINYYPRVKLNNIYHCSKTNLTKFQRVWNDNPRSC